MDKRRSQISQVRRSPLFVVRIRCGVTNTLWCNEYVVV
ncbi:hypothetical protein NSP_22230 [Nodularia spumigena CCY9414]|nr:hypothetical protein NSP_22230 [Nodularia spumigena CCY9414]